MYPNDDITSPARDAQRPPNRSHIIPAGKPKDIPKFDVEPNSSTEN